MSSTLADREAAFVAERLTGLGGSDAAAALGLSRWKTAGRLWAEKRGLVEHEDLSTNVAVELGTRLEDVIADMYAARHSCAVHRVNRTLRHRDYPFMMAHIDRRVVGEKRGLECKTAGLVSGRPDPDWGDGADAVPRDYFIQVQHYLAVTAYQSFDVPAIIAGKGYIEYTIGRDEELIAMIVQGENEFWKLVQDGIEPTVVNTDDARRRWPKSIAREIEATSAILTIDQKLRALESEKDKIDEAIEAHQTAIMAYLGEFDTLISGRQKLRTWRTQSTTRVDVTRLKTERPDLYAQFCKTSESRVFRKVEIK
jgi:putative phage-type endonuclease